MMTFKNIKENIKKSGDNSLISLFNALLLYDMEDIMDYEEDKVYNMGDIVYVYVSDEFPYHFFYEACVDNITGYFDSNKWRRKNIGFGESNISAKCIGAIYPIRKIIESSTRFINLTDYGVSKDAEKICIVFKNEKLLSSNEYYIDNLNNIYFINGVYSGDIITACVIENSGVAKYRSHNEISSYIGPDRESYISLSTTENLVNKFVLIIGDYGVFEEGTDYEIDGNIINFINSKSQKINIHIFGTEGDLNSCTCDMIKCTSDSSFISLNVSNWNHNTDDIILISSIKGVIPREELIMTNNTIEYEDGFQSGEVLCYIVLMNDIKIEKNKISCSELSSDIISNFLSPNSTITTDEFTFNFNDTETKVDISSFGITDDKYSIDFEVLSNNRGDVSFTFFSKSRTSFTARYSGLAPSVTVRFNIK